MTKQPKILISLHALFVINIESQKVSPDTHTFVVLQL